MIRAIVEQHAEDAAFLWNMRQTLIEAPHAQLEDLARFDRRLEANLDGLEVAGEGGAQIARRALAFGDAGDVFAGAVLACRASDVCGALHQLIEAAPAEALAPGLAGALRWLSAGEAEQALAALGAMASAATQRAELEACAAHGRDPGPALDRALERALLDADPLLFATALRAIGELGKGDRRAALGAGMQADEAAARFWAAWSASLLGDAAGAVVLREIAQDGGEYAEAAAGYAAVALPHRQSVAWIEALARRQDTRRIATRAAAALGDPAALPRLLDWLDEPELARVAGDAVSSITGTFIAGDLAGEAPAGFIAGPSDDPDDEDVAPDPDGHLAWPDAGAVRAACERRPLCAGSRYLLGRKWERASLMRALAVGRQPERARAAFELARMGGPLFDVAAPARRQRKRLTSVRAAQGQAPCGS